MGSTSDGESRRRRGVALLALASLILLAGLFGGTWTILQRVGVLAKATQALAGIELAVQHLDHDLRSMREARRGHALTGSEPFAAAFDVAAAAWPGRLVELQRLAGRPLDELRSQIKEYESHLRESLRAQADHPDDRAAQDRYTAADETMSLGLGQRLRGLEVAARKRFDAEVRELSATARRMQLVAMGLFGFGALGIAGGFALDGFGMRRREQARDALDKVNAGREQKFVARVDALAEAERRYWQVVEMSVDAVLLCDGRRRITYVNPAGAALLRRLDHAEPLGRSVDDLFGAAPVTAGPGWSDRLWDAPCQLPRVPAALKRTEGPSLPVELAATSYRKGSDLHAQIVIRELSDLLGEDASTRDQLRFNEQVVEAVPHALSLRDEAGRFLLVNRAFEAAHGIDRTRLLGKAAQDVLPAGVTAAIARNDAQAKRGHAPIDFDTRFDGVAGQARSVRIRVQALRRVDASLIGVMALETDVSALRDKEDELFALNAKMGQMSARLIEAQEDERRRISRDLHDQVGQILTALKLQLASLARRDSVEGRALAAPIELTEEALRHARDLTASLHPHLLDDLGLAPAMRWLIDRFIRPSLPEVELRCEMEPERGAAATELVAFRVVQEALTNVVRHAQATRAGVMLEAHDGHLSIEVFDDGEGFDAGNTWFDLQRRTSIGVASMRERVAELGGDFQIDSTPGVGTRLRAWLPW